MVTRWWIVTATALALLLVSPREGVAEMKVIDQPVYILVGQTFRVLVETDPGAGEVRVEAPAPLRLMSRWPFQAGERVQRFYFTATAPAAEVTLLFGEGEGTLRLPLQVLSWAEVARPRRFEKYDLPRIWPMGVDYQELKSGHTWYTREQIAAMREPGAAAVEADFQVSDAAAYEAMMPSNVPRACFCSPQAGCPVHGAKIFEGRSPFYPWVIDPEKHPYKVGCPVGGEWYPSNDYAAGDMHSGEFPDDGYGCDYKGNRYPFIAYYSEWTYHGRYNAQPIRLAQKYASTGDRRYARRCALMLFRIAEQYLNLAVNLNQRKSITRETMWSVPMGILPRENVPIYNTWLFIQHNWEVPQVARYGQAYDLIFDALQQDDPELLRFVQSRHHPEVRTMEDVRRFIETGYFRVFAQACLDRNIIGNLPQFQQAVLNLAMTLNTPRSYELVDWTFNREGQLRYFLTNCFFKDGAANESQGYNAGHVTNLEEIAQTMRRIAALNPGRYEAGKFPLITEDPKYFQIYDFCLNFNLIGRTHASTGDGGDVAGTGPLRYSQTTDVAAADFAGAYAVTRDRRFAQVLYGPEGKVANTVTDPALRREIEVVGREHGFDFPQESNFTDGYGHAILRSGEGDHRRAFWVRYGRTWGHAHDDLLTIGLEAMRRKLLPEIGYPHSWTYRSQWEGNWGTHYCARSTGDPQGGFRKGALAFLADTPVAKMALAVTSAYRPSTPPHTVLPDQVMERSLLLVDLSPEACYAVDLLRLNGGTGHTWSFHGPRGTAVAQAGPAGEQRLDAAAQVRGTAAGEQVAYGEHGKAPDKALAFLAFLTDVRRARPSEPWSLDWTLQNQKDVHLRMTMLSPADAEVILARGKPPGGGSPYLLDWAVVRREGPQGLASQFLSILEPYEGRRLVQRVERLPATPAGGANPQFPPLAWRVVAAERSDTFVAPGEPALSASATGVEGVTGRLGMVSRVGGQVRGLFLAEGTRLEADGISLSLPAAAYRGEITAVDYKRRALTVAPAPPFPEALVGRHLRITNGGSDTSYRVVSAIPAAGACEFVLDLDPRVGEGEVHRGDDGALLSKTSLTMAAIQRYYHGKTLSNEDGTAAYRTPGVSSLTRVLVDPARHGAVKADQLAREFTDRDGDGVPRFTIYDYGVGDQVSVPYAVSLVRRDAATLALDAPCAVTVSVRGEGSATVAPGERASIGRLTLLSNRR